MEFVEQGVQVNWRESQSFLEFVLAEASAELKTEVRKRPHLAEDVLIFYELIKDRSHSS